MNCPCGSQQLFARCCQPILEDPSKATTAEALMRARYTAHVRHEVGFVVQTVHPSTRSLHQAANIQAWMEETTWEGLMIRQTKAGQAKDQEGWVWFEAAYRQGRRRAVHREYSYFRREDQQWYFVNGKEPPAPQKVARNAPCPCGSGKKYKRCCGQTP